MGGESDEEKRLEREHQREQRRRDAETRTRKKMDRRRVEAVANRNKMARVTTGKSQKTGLD